MKPVEVVQAFACSCCGKVFEMKPAKWMLSGTTSTRQERAAYRARMKQFASACCTCPACGQKCDRYHGTSTKFCSKCKREKECEFAAIELEAALKKYEGVSMKHAWKDPSVESALAAHVTASTGWIT